MADQQLITFTEEQLREYVSEIIKVATEEFAEIFLGRLQEQFGEQIADHQRELDWLMRYSRVGRKKADGSKKTKEIDQSVR